MDKEFFTKQVLACETSLYRVAKTILHSETDCEDAVQTAILQAYEKRDTLQKAEYFRTWMTRILLNVCYQTVRGARPTVAYEEYFTDVPEERADYSDLYRAIRELKLPIRVTVLLYYIEGYSVNEIKKILGIPAGTVKSRLSKGRRELKNLLEDGDFEESRQLAGRLSEANGSIS